MNESESCPSGAEAVRRLVDAWNRRDPSAFGSLFTPEAEYVTGKGEHVRGRENVAALVDANRDASRIEVVGAPFVELGDTTGTVRFDWSTSSQGSVPRRGRITCRLAWRGTGWLVDALHNEELPRRDGRGKGDRDE